MTRAARIRKLTRELGAMRTRTGGDAAYVAALAHLLELVKMFASLAKVSR